jgi:hypothetical protein
MFFKKKFTNHKGILMKFNKNVIAFAFCLAMVCPVKCNDDIDETNRLTETQENIISEIASTVFESAIAAIDNAIQANQKEHAISIEKAHALLQNLMDSLVEGSTFEINDVKYIVAQVTKNITDESVTTDVQAISLEDALELLKNLENETTFSLKYSLNNTLYTVGTRIKAANDDTTSNN